ncbi:MAG: cyanophycin synthetase, partial [Gemmatimonadales bacterium]
GGQAIPLAIPGRHNLDNARLAVATAARIGLEPEAAARTLVSFPGLPHRLELVTERDGRRFFNDSKATTPQSTCLAVAAFDNSRTVHLLAGGYDKKVDLSGIVELAPRLAGLYTMGATGRSLVDATREGHAEFCETVENAVTRAVIRMKPGDVLLLSPGCASWDQFKNYEVRGAAFCSVVEGKVGIGP